MTVALVDAHERRRLRVTWGVVVGGAVGAVLAAAVTGLAGLPGWLGALSLVLVAALGCSVAAVHALVAALVDDMRGRHVTSRLPLVGLGLLLASGVLMVMGLGIAAS